MKFVIGVVAVLSIPLLFGWFVIDGLKTGSVHAKGGKYSRTEDPFWFWALIAAYLGLVALWVWGSSYALYIIAKP